MKFVSLEANASIAGKAGDPARIKGQRAVEEVTIEAPPELVWDFVADFAGWASWNPLYPKTSGSAEVGQAIRFSVQLDGMKPQRAKALVWRIEPNALLEYRVSSFLGLLKIVRYVEIEELSPTRSRVINGEIMGGPLGRPVFRMLGEKVGKGLGRMNAALKVVAERKWRGRPG